MLTSKRALIGILLVPAFVSCGDGTLEPDHFANLYVLQNTPVVLEAAGNATYRILSDTLDLGVSPALRRTRMQHVVGVNTDEFTVTQQYALRFGRARLELDLICPPNALMLCTPPPHLWGLPDGSELVLRSQIDPAVALRYARVPSPWLP